jgi:hypothetical protein
LNLNDKRTQSKLLQIINWLETYVGAEQKTLNSKILRKPEAFGDSQLGRNLRQQLLIKTCPAYKPGVFSQQYRVNVDVLNNYRTKLGLAPSLLRHHNLDRRFEQQAEAIATGDFDYNDTGHRWFDGLQYIPRTLKGQLWAEQGYHYDYDIECCAPNLLLQQARRLNPSMKQLDYINYYLTNKTQVRDELSIKHNLDTGQIKQIINGLFQGGILNHYKDNKILTQVLGNNQKKMSALIEDPYIKEFIKDIKYMWKQISNDIDTGHEYRGEVRRKKKITGRHKSEYYKKLEREVMTPVWKYLKKISVRVHREHDGFRSDVFVIPDELEQVVLVNTGFHVKFVWNKIEVSDTCDD